MSFQYDGQLSIPLLLTQCSGTVTLMPPYTHILASKFKTLFL